MPAAPHADPVIRVRGLRKQFGDREALHGIDLDVRRGETVALVGPNGAGKTTAVEILEGFHRRSGGEVAVLGADPARPTRAWRERIGIVTQESEPDPGLSVREAVALYAGYRTRPRPVDETLERVGLTDAAAVQATALSGGQRRRLDLALALVGDPELLFLDEPTTGFDPTARRAAWELVAGLRARGRTILLTTHDMREAEHLADRVVVLAAGRVVADAAPAALGDRDGAATRIAFRLPDARSVAELPEPLRARVTGAGPVLELRSRSPLADVGELAAWARRRDIDIADLTVSRASLEDVYLTLTEEVTR
jgi:ABC-2 type transport system ATP-binding protein